MMFSRFRIADRDRGGLAGHMKAPSQTQVTMTTRSWAALCLLACLWGFSFLGMRVALNEIGPFAVVAHRTTWAMVLLWLYLLATGIPMPRGRRIWAAFAVMGLFNNMIPFSLIAWGQQSIETGLASILNASTAVWGVLLAAMLQPDERLTPRRAIGVAIGFVGVATAIGLNNLRALDLRSVSQLAILGAAVSYGIAGVWARRRLKGLRPEVAATGMLTCSALVMLPVASLVEGPVRFDLSLNTWAALAYVSIVATGLAYLLYYRVLSAAGSGNAMLTTLLVAPVAIVAGAIILGEALPARAFTGFGLIAFGLVVLDGRLAARLFRWHKKSLAPPAPPG